MRNNHTQQIIDNKQETPLIALSNMLANEMEKVDHLIIKNMQSDVPIIPKLAEYLISSGGKRIRPLLTLASTALFNGPMDQAQNLAAAVEFIHTATLLHDDVVDESYERRGKKTANLVFGNQASVLIGDFLFSKSFQMMVQSGSLEVLSILSKASTTIAKGEVLQLTTTNDIETSMPVYLDVIESKTAALFAASCEVGAVISNQDQDIINAMRNYGTKLGTAFQIIDDALDYAADQKTLGKEIGDDFKEGKITAPIIFSLQNANDNEHKFWQRTLGHKNQENTDFSKALNIIKSHNAIEKTIDLARKYADEANKALSVLPKSKLKNILYDLTYYTITRNF